MDVKYVNPFIEAFSIVMPQLGFTTIKKAGIGARGKEIVSTGVIIVLGIIGEIKGNIVYVIDFESAKKIASTMMMGMPVPELDEMAQSALSELTNMLTANAATCFSNIGVTVDISTPTLLYGNQISVKMSSDKVLSVKLEADSIPMEVNISFENN